MECGAWKERRARGREGERALRCRGENGDESQEMMDRAHHCYCFVAVAVALSLSWVYVLCLSS